MHKIQSSKQVFSIAGVEVKPGEFKTINLPAAKLYTDIDIAMPIHVIRGKRPGPTVFISAAIHGDELNGIEIIRRLLTKKTLNTLRGILIAVPIVNVYGVLNQSRYLPDRRDLNRSFPGSAKGTLAGRIAHLFLNEIVNKCDYGIDLHTGAIHRSNLPQVRANLDDEETLELAKAFGVPVLLNSNIRDGSLRGAATEQGVKVLLYEAGEALRFNELSIRAGVSGVLNVLAHLKMIRKSVKHKNLEPFVARSSNWVRASSSGIVRENKQLGDFVEKGELLAEIGDPLGFNCEPLYSKISGIIIGKTNIPLVHEGEAMFHIAYFQSGDEVAEEVEQMPETFLPEDYTSIIQ
ncbi:succinylglutamate desuccinylase/aspartoacylase family protein [Catenovulum sp. 2E275]|uniref:succinylglutamate desuccinylase/aspartoacylase family protein n=1 Tax=Catenovulum sp. 2E275 TaxID=2980497 RepID=UPI0021CFC36F|nr:succinylglutamate desuccinylase/aspartoacylase family protein [Catenovulum sp. 2E275]MCU4674593.1 succinylglutamate desuccinylase/aspartoacylase family protein [Catenovulum sp. 2E275]